MAAGGNAITTRLENPFSSLLVPCPLRWAVRTDRVFLILWQIRHADERWERGNLFRQEWSWSGVSASSKGLLTTGYGVGSIWLYRASLPCPLEAKVCAVLR